MSLLSDCAIRLLTYRERSVDKDAKQSDLKLFDLLLQLCDQVLFALQLGVEAADLAVLPTHSRQ